MTYYTWDNIITDTLNNWVALVGTEQVCYMLEKKILTKEIENKAKDWFQ